MVGSGRLAASVKGTPSSGSVIYSGGAYFYGPSIFTDSAGIHVYGCSPGSNGAWDSINYQVSTDGGNTWSGQQVVLQPTAGSADAYSTCDPGVVFFGGYYYIGYTSTTNVGGIQNNVFVARSTSPTGPFSKWNGSGWGGNPQPFITYNGAASAYGAGEPALVAVGNTLYVYYTWLDQSSNGTPTAETRVATASTTDANWPGSLTFQGTAISKRSDLGPDSSDVKYIDAYGKFVAVNTINRFGPKATIQMWESTDGIHFTPSNLLPDTLLPYLHNDGISGDSAGHIDVTARQFIGYAYGSIWAHWATYLNPITYTDDALPGKVDIYSVEAKNGAVRLEFQPNSSASGYNVSYGTASGSYSSTVTGVTASPYTITGLTNGKKYFVAVAAVNSSGTGPYGSQVSATPQNYQQLTPFAAAASSTQNGYSANAVIDGNLTNFWTSVGHGGSGATEWVSVDFGSSNSIARLVIDNRQYSGYGSPTLDGNLDTLVQVSSDNATWFNIDYRLSMYQIVDDDGLEKTIIDFPQPVYARYVRLYAKTLNTDNYGTYYLQLGELQAYAVPVTATASTNINGWEPTYVLDLDQNTAYSSYPGDTSPWLQLNLGSVQTIGGVNVTPRSDGSGFPVAFSLQSSTDGSSWSTIPGQSYTSYAKPTNGAVQPFTFSAPVSAQYLRLVATQLGTDNYNNPYLQIAGMAVRKTLNFTATASSQISGWPASNLTDALPATLWSSTSHSSSNATEWVQLDLGASQRVQDLRLVPRDGYGFPSALAISYSQDGSTWTAVPGQTYGSFVNPASAGSTPNPVQLFWFSTPVTARYLRVTATSLAADSNGAYSFQLADVLVDQ